MKIFTHFYLFSTHKIENETNVGIINDSHKINRQTEGEASRWNERRNFYSGRPN